MKYENPELTVVTPAINAVQTSEIQKCLGPLDALIQHDVVAAYEDWEE